MFCKYCGQQIGEEANFCPHCGGSVKAPAVAPVQTVAPMQTAVPVQAVAPVQTAVPVQAVAPVQTKPVNGLGIASFVIGIVSLFLGYYVFIISIAGIVLGAIGVARRNKYRLNGLAIAGLVISCVACVIWFFARIILLQFYLFLLPFLI